MKRIILMLLAFMAISTMVRAEDFNWLRPGSDPYQGTKVQALALLSRGKLIPPSIVAALMSAPCYRDTIHNDMRITRMTFGKNVMVPNVVARVSQWRDSAKRSATVCEFEDRSTGRLYVLLQPDECGNWSIVIYNTQRQCVIDTLLCDESCKTVKRNQTSLR